MSEFDVSTEYKLQVLNQRLEQLNVEGWHNEEARLIAVATGNAEEQARVENNIQNKRSEDLEGVMGSAPISLRERITGSEESLRNFPNDGNHRAHK